MNLRVHAIDPQRHELPRLLLVALRLSKAPQQISTYGAWQLPPGLPPTLDRPRPDSFRRGVLPKDLGITLPPGVRGRCHNYFPAGGGMDWHTDSGDPGWRMYVFRCGPGRSTFYYRDRFFVEPEEGAYVFWLDKDAWHAIESYRDRFSCGVQLTDQLAHEIVSAAGTP